MNSYIGVQCIQSVHNYGRRLGKYKKKKRRNIIILYVVEFMNFRKSNGFKHC